MAMLGYYATPNFQMRVQNHLFTAPLSCFLWGFLSIILILPVTMFLLLSVVGIPLMPLQFSIYFLFFVFGYIHGALVISKHITKMSVDLAQQATWVRLLLGLVALEGLSFVPYIGTLIKWSVIFVGFGAVSHVFYGQLLKPPSQKVAGAVDKFPTL